MIVDQLPALIPLLLLAGALLVPLCRRGSRVWPYAVALVAIGSSLACSVGALVRTLSSGKAIHYYFGGWQPPIGIELIVDPLSAFFSILISGIALFVLWHGRKLVSEQMPGKEVPFYSVVLLLLGGFSGLVLTGDLFNLYVFLEISSIATYALVSIGSKKAPVAAFRYLIYGTVGASFYLLGVGFIFVSTGSLNMADVAAILNVTGQTNATLVGIVLIVIGLGVKMALFPLHGWLADAYTYASSTASALVAPIGTKVAAYAMIRILFYGLEIDFVRTDTPITTAILWLGAGGVLWGGLMAMAQNNFKRLLAYSSVSHLGYIALGIGLASPLGLIAAVLHTLNHAVMKGCLFLISGSILSKTGQTNISEFQHSLRVRMPWTMGALTVAAISMIGLPPTAGFFSKWYLVLGLFEQQLWLMIGVIILSSLFGIVYFFRVLERVYLRPQEGEELNEEPVRDEVSASMLWPVLIMSAGLIVLGFGNFIIVREIITPMLPVDL
ncbi:MAG TPA: monovalent cation/H+ antiporter subunit D family protein [Opitutales bacterium]|nr:monovalent cation/H+ antiporter subunit D family protein [Opitutales bacterium]